MQEITSLCDKIGSNLHNIQEITSDFIRRSTKGLSSFSEVLPSLTSYGPMLPQNKFIEPVSPGCSSPCYSIPNDNANQNIQRDLGYTLYDIGRMFLDNLSVTEIQRPSPETGRFSCLLLYGLNNRQFVNDFLTMLRNSHLNPEYKDARIVIFKGRLSFLMQFDSLPLARDVCHFLKNDFYAKECIKCRWQVLWVHNKLLDPQYMASFYAVVLKNLPPDCSVETLQHLVTSNCGNASYTHIDTPVFVGHTVCSLIRTLTLEDAEMIALGLNGLLTKTGTIQAGLHPDCDKQHKHTSRDPFKGIKEYKPEPILVKRRSVFVEEKPAQDRQQGFDQGLNTIEAPFNSLNMGEPSQQYVNRENRAVRAESGERFYPNKNPMMNEEPIERDQFMNYRNTPYEDNFGPRAASYGHPQREGYNTGYDEFSRYDSVPQRPGIPAKSPYMPADGRALYDPFPEQPRTAVQPMGRQPSSYQENMNNEDHLAEIPVKEEWTQAKNKEPPIQKDVNKELVHQPKMGIRGDRPPIDDPYERQRGYPPPYSNPYYGDNQINPNEFPPKPRSQSQNAARVYDPFGNLVPPTDLDYPNRPFPRRDISPHLGNVLEQHHSQYHQLAGQGTYAEPLPPRSITPKVSKITTPHGKYTVVTQVFMSDQDVDVPPYVEPQPPGRPGWNGEPQLQSNWDVPRRNVKDPQTQMGLYNKRYTSDYSTQFDEDPNSSSQFSPPVGPMSNILSPHQDPHMGMGMFPHRQKSGMMREDLNNPLKREDLDERFRRRSDRMEGYMDPNMPRNYQPDINPLENRHRNPQGNMYNPDYATGPLYDPARPGPGRKPMGGHPGMPGPMGNVDRRYNPGFEEGRGRYPMEEERYPHNDPRDFDYNNQKFLNYAQSQMDYNQSSSYPYPRNKNAFLPAQEQYSQNFGPFSKKDSIDNIYHPAGQKPGFPPQQHMNPEYNDNEYDINQHNRVPPGRFRPGMEVEPDMNRQNNRLYEPQFQGPNAPGFPKQEEMQDRFKAQDRYQPNRPPENRGGPNNQIYQSNLQGDISPFDRQRGLKKPDPFVKQESFMQGGPGMPGIQSNRLIPHKGNEFYDPPQNRNMMYNQRDFGPAFPIEALSAEQDRNKLINSNFDPYVNPSNLANEKRIQHNHVDPFKDLTLPDVVAMRDAMTISPKNFESLYTRSAQMNLNQFSELNNVLPLDKLQDLDGSKEPKDIALVVLDTSSEDESPREAEPPKVNKVQIGIETSTKRLDPRLSLRQEIMKETSKTPPRSDPRISPLPSETEAESARKIATAPINNPIEVSKPKEDIIQTRPLAVKSVTTHLKIEQPGVNKTIENTSKSENYVLPPVITQPVKPVDNPVPQPSISIEKLIAEANSAQKKLVSTPEASSAGQISSSAGVASAPTTETKKIRKSRFSYSLEGAQANQPNNTANSMPNQDTVRSQNPTVNPTLASSQVKTVTAQVLPQAEKPAVVENKELSQKDQQSKKLEEFYKQLLLDIAEPEPTSQEEAGSKPIPAESVPLEKPLESEIKPQLEQEQPVKKIKVTKGIQTDEESDTEMQDNQLEENSKEGINAQNENMKIKLENGDPEKDFAKKLTRFRTPKSEKEPVETQPSEPLEPAPILPPKPYKRTYPRRSYNVEPRFRLLANGLNPIKDFNFGILSDPFADYSSIRKDGKNVIQRPPLNYKRTLDQYLQDNQAAKYNNGYYTNGQNKNNQYKVNGPMDVLNNPVLASQILMNNNMLGLMSGPAIPGFIDPDSVFAGTFQNQVVISSVQPEGKVKTGKGNSIVCNLCMYIV